MRIITILSLLLLTTNNKLTNAFRMVNMKIKIDAQDTFVSDITGDSKSISTMSTVRVITLSSTRSKPRWGVLRPIDTLKWASVALAVKVFVKDPTQAPKYDEVYKLLIAYVGTIYDYRVWKAFETKDRNTGLTMLTKPSAPTTRKIIQEAIAVDISVLKGVEHITIYMAKEECIEITCGIRRQRPL